MNNKDNGKREEKRDGEKKKKR